MRRLLCISFVELLMGCRDVLHGPSGMFYFDVDAALLVVSPFQNTHDVDMVFMQDGWLIQIFVRLEKHVPG